MSDRKPIRKAVFPVAGLGTRFLPATKAIPKELLPIVDQPLIQYAVDEAREAGIEPRILGGAGCYAVSLVVWIMALSRVPVSIAYPMLSIGYVVSATFIVAIVNGLPGMAGQGAWVFLAIGIAAAPACILWDLIARRSGQPTQHPPHAVVPPGLEVGARSRDAHGVAAR